LIELKLVKPYQLDQSNIVQSQTWESYLENYLREMIPTLISHNTHTTSWHSLQYFIIFFVLVHAARKPVGREKSNFISSSNAAPPLSLSEISLERSSLSLSLSLSLVLDLPALLKKKIKISLFIYFLIIFFY